MKADGEDQVINLLRCAWAGSQKYGAWSGQGIFTPRLDRCATSLPPDSIWE